MNATDLRNLPYPTLEQLSELGKKLKAKKEWNQTLFDELSKEVAD